MTDAARIIRDRAGAEAPGLAIMLGSGLGALAGDVEDAVRIPFSDLPGFPASGVTGTISTRPDARRCCDQPRQPRDWLENSA